MVLCSTSRLRSGGTKSCGCAALVDLTGRRFGSLVVLQRAASRRKQHGAFWRVLCEDCGKTAEVRSQYLRNGQRNNCGCQRPARRAKLIGKCFGLLTVVRFVGQAAASGAAIWECRCACTGTVERTTAHLRRSLELSCGCLTWQFLHRRENEQWHRHSRKQNGLPSPTYISWRSMLGRCSVKAKGQYGGRYFDRGIRVCKRWRGVGGFLNFLADMGERPVGRTLDRFPDRDGNYEPGNCRWATASMQAQNRETPSELRVKLRRAEQHIKLLERRLIKERRLLPWVAA